MIAAAATLVAIALVVATPPLFGWSIQMWRAAGLTLITIAAWALGVLPHGAIAAGYLALAIAFGVGTFDDVLAGLRSSVFWLVAAGMLIGFAIAHTGLGERVARRSVALVGGSYVGILAGVATAGALLAFIVPSSMGRVLTLVPIAVAIADRCGLDPRSDGRAGLVIVAATACFLPAGAVLTGLMPNVLLASAADANYGLDIAYARYLWLHFPVMGLLRTCAIVLVATMMFRPASIAPTALEDARGSARASGAERFLGGLLIVTLALWVSDGWHGIAPGWVAVAAACVLLLGGRRVVPLAALVRRFDFGALLYVLAVVAMGRIIVESGLATHAGDWLVSVLPLGANSAQDIYVLSCLSAVIGLLVTNPVVPAVLSPLAGPFASASGLSVEAVLMTQAVGFSNVVLPYQASPVLVAMLMSGTPVVACARFTLALTLVSFVVLLPLEIMWWRLLGLF